MLLSNFFLAAYMLAVGQAVAVPKPQAAPAVVNPFTSPTGGNLNSGTGPINIAWTPSTQGTITITLVKGPEGNQVDAATVATAIGNSGTYSWNVPKDVQDSASMNGDKYALKIIDDATGGATYSAPFDLTVPGSTFQAAGQPSNSNPAPSQSPSPSQSAPSDSSSAEPQTSSETSASPTVQIAAVSSSSIPSPTSSGEQGSTVQQTSSPAKTASGEAPTFTAVHSKVSGAAVNSANVNAAEAASPTGIESAAGATKGGRDPADDNSNKVNTGVIVGSVVGGVAGIALLVGGILLFMRRRRRAATKKMIRSSAYKEKMKQVDAAHENYMRSLEADEQRAREAQETAKRDAAIRQYGQSNGMVNAF
ncbi:hypothetical protein EDC01DRAFT_335517 [Geopyxis carbonaria]|nr:hypothetical protein EDC01DRAFT_335517 [Geopyxis carbonaria]